MIWADGLSSAICAFQISHLQPSDKGNITDFAGYLSTPEMYALEIDQHFNPNSRPFKQYRHLSSPAPQNTQQRAGLQNAPLKHNPNTNQKATGPGIFPSDPIQLGRPGIKVAQFRALPKSASSWTRSPAWKVSCRHRERRRWMTRCLRLGACGVQSGIRTNYPSDGCIQGKHPPNEMFRSPILGLFSKEQGNFPYPEGREARSRKVVRRLCTIFEMASTTPRKYRFRVCFVIVSKCSVLKCPLIRLELGSALNSLV